MLAVLSIDVFQIQLKQFFLDLQNSAQPKGKSTSSAPHTPAVTLYEIFLQKLNRANLLFKVVDIAVFLAAEVCLVIGIWFTTFPMHFKAKKQIR